MRTPLVLAVSFLALAIGAVPASAAGVASIPSFLGNKGVVPLAGPAGTAVTLTGYSFLSVIDVSFGDVKAKFTIVSPTTIKTTVPKGAKTGKIYLTYQIGASTSQGGTTPSQGTPHFGKKPPVISSPERFTVK